MRVADNGLVTGAPGDARTRIARALAYTVFALGVLVLLGWAFRVVPLKSVAPGYVAMNPTTALSFIVLSIGLLAIDALPRLARAAGLIAAVVGALKLAELLLELPTGVDQLLFRAELQRVLSEPPNRIAPNTAVSLLLLGTAVAVLGKRVGRLLLSELFALCVGLLSFFALVGYGYGLRTLYGVGPFIPMAPHTAVGLVLTSSAVLLLRADHGVTALLFRPTLVGAMARRLFPAALLLPPIIGWLRLLGERRGLYPREVGVALFAVTLTVILLALLFLTAGSLERIDALRIRTQRQLEELARRLVESNQELERLATIDGLTGVLNRRAWLAHAEIEIAKAKRHKLALSVLMLDADHFKRINDVHGHATGDRVLCAIAECLRNQLRVGDVVGRYGGEEFCVLLPVTSADGAMVVADRCCKAIRELDLRASGALRLAVRCSIGVAELDHDRNTIEQLLHGADGALYVAKVERNCVRRASAPESEEYPARSVN